MDKKIKIAGKKIFYRVYGNGSPVMLVHGFGETGDVWNNQAGPPQTSRMSGTGSPKEGLTNNFMFIIPDLPGSGQSEMIDDMSMEGMAEILKNILDHESISNAVMIGHSMGGYVTLAFAEKHESLLHAFGLFHSSAFADTEEKKAVRRKGIEFIKEHGAFEFLKTSTPNLFSQRSKDEFPELISQFIQSLDNFSATALVSYYDAMIKRPDRTQVLKTTKLPVLFIMGEQDSVVPIQDGLKLSHLPEKAYFHVLHQSAHMGMLEESEKTNRLLEEFLSR